LICSDLLSEKSKEEPPWWEFVKVLEYKVSASVVLESAAVFCTAVPFVEGFGVNLLADDAAGVIFLADAAGVINMEPLFGRGLVLGELLLPANLGDDDAMLELAAECLK
jgi:hypothetical protein